MSYFTYDLQVWSTGRTLGKFLMYVANHVAQNKFPSDLPHAFYYKFLFLPFQRIFGEVSHVTEPTHTHTKNSLKSIDMLRIVSASRYKLYILIFIDTIILVVVVIMMMMIVIMTIIAIAVVVVIVDSIYYYYSCNRIVIVCNGVC